MKPESIKEIVQLCIAGRCSIRLEASQTGVVAIVIANRGEVMRQTSVWLDKNDEQNAEKLWAAVERVQ